MEKLGSLQLVVLIWEKAKVVKILLLKFLSRPTNSAVGSEYFE